MSRHVLPLFLLLTATQAQEIPVTRTWGDLRAAPEHKVGDGLRVRLGVDKARYSKSATAQIYILVEGHADTPHCPVHFLHDGAPNRFLQGLREIERVEPTTESPRIYLHPVRLPASGDPLVVQAQDPDGRMLAEVDLTSDDFVAPSWFGLRGPGTGRALRTEEGQPDLLRARLTHAPNRPWTDIMAPLAIGEDQDKEARPPANDAPLPTLHPSAPSPDLQIARVGDKIRVSCTRAIRISPDMGHLLVRLWHNGEVVAPKGNRGGPQNISGKVHKTRTFLLEFDFERASLGIGADDPLEIEILHCPDSAYVGDDMLRRPAALFRSGPILLPLLSNRLPLP